MKIDFSVRDKDIHLDFDVPLRVRQAVIPVLAVGLYYGVDSATVSSITRYIFQFMSMKPDSADVVVRAAHTPSVTASPCHLPQGGRLCLPAAAKGPLREGGGIA